MFNFLIQFFIENCCFFFLFCLVVFLEFGFRKFVLRLYNAIIVSNFYFYFFVL